MDIIKLLIEYGEYCDSTISETRGDINLPVTPTFEGFISWLKDCAKTEGDV